MAIEPVSSVSVNKITDVPVAAYEPAVKAAPSSSVLSGTNVSVSSTDGSSFADLEALIAKLKLENDETKLNNIYGNLASAYSQIAAMDKNQTAVLDDMFKAKSDMEDATKRVDAISREIEGLQKDREKLVEEGKSTEEIDRQISEAQVRKAAAESDFASAQTRFDNATKNLSTESARVLVDAVRDAARKFNEELRADDTGMGVREQLVNLLSSFDLISQFLAGRDDILADEIAQRRAERV